MERDIQIIVKKVEDGKIDFVEATKQILLLFSVSGRSEQLKAFADYAQKRMWDDGDKDLSEFVDEFLRL